MYNSWSPPLKITYLYNWRLGEVFLSSADNTRTSADDSRFSANDFRRSADDSRTSANVSRSSANDSRTSVDDSRTFADNSCSSADDFRTVLFGNHPQCYTKQGFYLSKPALLMLLQQIQGCHFLFIIESIVYAKGKKSIVFYNRLMRQV